jgi:hypothetical protein
MNALERLADSMRVKIEPNQSEEAIVKEVQEKIKAVMDSKRS